MSFKYEETLCPDCNGPMISRTGKFGVFWGCKNFPKCKGTRDSLGRSKADRAKERGEEPKYGAAEGLAEEIDKYDLSQGNKFSFKRKR